MNKKNSILFYTLTIITIIIFSGIGYAYFSAGVSNTNNEKVNAHAATLSLVFEDNDSGVSGNLSLDQSITKKFTIENTGTVDTYAKINWYNLVNTYTRDSLTWTLEQSTSENGSYSSIDNGNVPTSSVETTITLKNGILVPVNTKYYYKLTITLNNLDVEQNSDINGAFYSYFNLEEGNLSGVEKIQNLVADAPTNSVNVITRTAPTGASCTNTLAYDGTTDNNLRYVGSNPCNYVTFNGETAGWRIIGVMNNIDDGEGNLETRIKLIRKDSLGSYSWDSSVSEINNGRGVNDWSIADLKNELNEDYLNTSLTANTSWYNGTNNQKTASFNITKRLNEKSQSKIGNAKWYLGGLYDAGSYTSELIPSTMYNMERGTKVYPEVSGQNCSDVACPRVLFWVGKVALIYPSDYALATAGGNETNRYTCIKTYTTSINASDNRWNLYTDCRNNDWIFSSSSIQWTISPDSYSRSRSNTVYTNGIVYDYLTSDTYAVRPSVYLTSEVSIASGSGIETDPYVIG